MYEAFYGLKEKPFSLLPDPSFLFLGHGHAMAYSMLEYGILSQAGFTLITGDVGCGKTTLIRRLLGQLDPAVTVGLISNTGRSVRDLLKSILLAFRQEYRGKDTIELNEALEDFLIAEYAVGHRCVLIVDEAQNLDMDTLEELRLLSNINADKHLVLQLILVGQTQLRVKLGRQQLQQFAQRIAVSFHLRPLSEAETAAYIEHRLRHAGGHGALFSPQACQRIYRESGGIPRLINVLCDMALVYGYAEQATQIGGDLVQAVIEDRAGSHVSGSEEAHGGAPVEALQEPPVDDPKVTVFDRDHTLELFSGTRRR